ncbi:MAG: lipopolysaccharide heptosyltransferase II [Chlorobiaceae bacterium]|nr:lipopolysaccharide heptosyltransferase II [Chlorobiaceae bacterium]NTW10274.1 lipopolysaccharide heptosyltransferase II [Chlorobiaceae bacterium]
MNPSIVLLPNWIGDMLLALSVISKLPESRLSNMTLLVPKNMGSLVGLLCGLPQIAFARADEGEVKHTLALVRAGGFSTIYLCPFSFSSAWFAMKAGIQQRRGLSKQMRRFLLSEPLSGNLRDKTRHLTFEYAEIFGTSFFPPEEWNGVRIVPDERFAGSIVYCPGAAYGPAKRWPHFPALAKLQEQYSIVVLGTDDDSESAREILQHAHGRGIDLTGKTSLTEAAAIMAGARAVVSNDSGLMHLAGYIGVPVIGLFGSTSPVWTRPLGHKSVALKSAEPCSPCFSRTCRYRHYRCQENISPNNVTEALESLCG